MNEAEKTIAKSSQIVSEKVREQFFRSFNKTEKCWIWTGQINTSTMGYGVVWVWGNSRLAHRISWVIFKGPIPAGLCALHKCDNPRCVNPDHLFLGTRSENLEDMTNKNRRAVGVQLRLTHLTPDDVAAIRTGRLAGKKYHQLAKEHQVSLSAIYRIINRKTFRYVS